MKIVSVIVDLPTRQTDQPFTYILPDDLRQDDYIGCRVIVPFGNRRLLGYIVADAELDDQKKNMQLKEIESLIDQKPILDQQSLELSSWLAKAVFSYRVQVIQSMLPNAYKAKYLKRLRMADNVDDPKLKELFAGQDQIDFSPKKYSSEQLKEIRSFIKKGMVIPVSTIGRRDQQKKILVYENRLAEQEIKELAIKNRTSAQQKKLLNFLNGNQHGFFTKKEISEIASVSPAVIKRAADKGWLEESYQRLDRDPLKEINPHKSFSLHLNDQQQAVYDKVEQAIVDKKNKTFLLEGITGSGKTEIYLQLIQKTIDLGRGAILLVPEISLTPQMIDRVKSRFAQKIALIHSGLSDGQRMDQWQEILDKKIRIVIGTRSAIFAPVADLGLIIIDEEHESNYKQEDNPRYSAKQVALWRSDHSGAAVLLGSATPSLESRARAEKGIYELLKIDKRAVSGSLLPKVKIIDMRQNWQKEHSDSDFSPELLDQIKKNKQDGQQTILLLNRRGFSSFLMCRNCGFVPHCPNCNLSLTLHLDSHSLKCHYCGYQEPIPKVCPICSSNKIRYVGTGTEKVERRLQQLLPELRIVRLDQDSTKKKGSLQKYLNDFSKMKYDVMVGTQIVAKGLDFPKVTLVGVINADTALNLPDYRAEEKTFQLLTQVAGRSGRSKRPGQVIIQSYNPDNYAISLAAEQNYEKFFRTEMHYRHLADYSPYFFIAQISVNGPDQFAAGQAIEKVAEFVKPRLDKKTIVLGPTPKAIARLDNRYYFQMIIKYKRDPNLDPALNQLQEHFSLQLPANIYLSIDKDPVSFI